MNIVTMFDTLIFGLLAMSVVFGVLALLGFIISLFKTFFYKEVKPPRELVKKEEAPKEEIVHKRENIKKIAAISAAINMYLSSKKGVRFAFSQPIKGDGVDSWKIKSALGKKVMIVKERRWKNG